MAITTPPAAAADSYCDEATATAYLATRLNATAWTSADTATREAALKMATRRLEAEDWLGQKADELSANALRWPRALVYNADGQVYPSDSVPLAIQYATAELALDLLKAAADETANAAGGTAATEEVSVGPIKLKLDNSAAAFQTASEPLSSEVDTLIAPFRNSAVTGALVRA